MRIFVISILIFGISFAFAVQGLNSSNTDFIKIQSAVVSPPNNSDVINYTVEWTLNLNHIAVVGCTPVFDTLLWVSSGGRASSADPNWILIYTLNTTPPTLIDSFQQAATATWGYRDMCFYNGYVYAGTEAALHKIDPITHTVVGTYSVSGISGSVIRALADNDVQDSLYTCNWGVPIYKFSNQGGAVRTVAANTYSVYGLAHDPHGFMWGATQTVGSELAKYSYPACTYIEGCAIPQLGTGIAGGCEMWKDTFLLYVNQGTVDQVLCLRLYTPSFTADVGVDAIHVPGGTYPAGTPMTPSARIKNYGSAAQTNFSVVCSIIGTGGPAHVNTQTVASLAAGDTTQLSFGTWANPTAGTYTTKIRTLLTGDQNPTNDMMSVVTDVGAWLLMEGFNGTTFPPAGWQAVIGTGTRNWERSTAGTYPTCTPYEGAAMATYQSWYATSGSWAQLISPAIPITGTTPCSLKFYMTHDPGYSSNADRIIIQTSPNGTTWTPVDSFLRYAASFAWTQHAVYLGSFSSNFYICFLARSAYGNNMYMDYVKVTAPVSGIVEDGNNIVNMTSLNTVSPNPAKGIAHISFNIAKPTSASLRIYDASGRIIKTLLSSNLESGAYNLTWNGKDDNNRAVAEGVYFYTLETENHSQTKKLVLTR